MTDGAIKVERNNSHVYVEWNFNVDVSEGAAMTFRNGGQKNISPTFEIGNQSYSLCSHRDYHGKCFSLTLSRAGPPLGRSLWWWADLKCPDYIRRQRFGNLCPREECQELLKIDGGECHSMLSFGFRASSNFILYFQVQVEEESAGTETFTHDVAKKMFPPSDGQIYEKECSCLKHVEWTLDFDWNRQDWASSVFKTGDQLFRFVFSRDINKEYLTLELYWLGPSVDDPGISAQCWAGLKRCDGTYHHRNETHEFFVKGGSSKRPLNLMWVRSEIIENHHLDRNKRLTFFLRINEETGAEPCNSDRPEEFPRGVGSIQQELLSPYVLVQWTFAVDKINEVSSPVFVVDNQNYVLSFENGPVPYAKCSLSRKGPSADRDVRYLGAVRRSDNLYDELGYGHGQFNLRKTADFWFLQTSISEFRSSEKWKEFTVDLLLTCDESPAAGTLCFSTVSEAGEDLIDSPEMDPSFVVFKVEDTAFKIHKGPILVCVPVFKNMLTHECLGSKTSVVTIKDCKAVFFKEFLELVEVGFQRNPSAENAWALYDVANKYLLCHLKDKCCAIIEENLSVDNFCDVLELVFAYEEKYLVGSAAVFLFRNNDIIESVRFHDVRSRFPDAVNELMEGVAFLNQFELWEPFF